MCPASNLQTMINFIEIKISSRTQQQVTYRLPILYSLNKGHRLLEWRGHVESRDTDMLIFIFLFVGLTNCSEHSISHSYQNNTRPTSTTMCFRLNEPSSLPNKLKLMRSKKWTQSRLMLAINPDYRARTQCNVLAHVVFVSQSDMSWFFMGWPVLS